MKKENLDTVIALDDYRIDNLDRQILSHLLEDANRPFTDIAQKLNVSNGTVHVRMKKLREMGLVTGATLTVDVRKLGYDIIAFVGVSMEKGIKDAITITAMEGIPEIIEAYATTGNYCFLLKVICRNTEHLFQVLRDQVQQINGVVRTETFLILQEGIKRSVQFGTPSD
jgi:Lrp/AsnC family transcriptional regulator, regulator for asnA, asnC and gidA